jgi:colanic acid/amylovoran biosynthesis glycosyltransferase
MDTAGRAGGTTWPQTPEEDMSPYGIRRIAYLSSSYARASDSFIRDEVAALRRHHVSVTTFAIRAPSASEQVSDEVRASRLETTYILSAGTPALLAAVLWMAGTHPRRLATCVRLARGLASPGLRGQVWPLLYLVEACYLAALLQKRKVEHLHNHIGEGSAAVALLAGTLADVPFSLTIHGPGEWDRPERLALGLKVSRAAFVVAISAYTRGQMLRWCAPTDWPKIHVIKCGIDPTGLDVLTPVPDVSQFVTVGRLASEKGHCLLISALGDLKRHGVEATLVVIGDGDERASLERQARDCGVHPALTFRGWGSAETVAKEIRGSRALVVPSLAEGLPVVIMEALALGRPVISSAVAAVPELVIPGESGWLVQPGSIEDLASTMRTVLDTPTETLSEMGRRGAARVAAEHSIETQVTKLLTLIQTGGRA